MNPILAVMVVMVITMVLSIPLLTSMFDETKPEPHEEPVELEPQVYKSQSLLYFVIGIIILGITAYYIMRKKNILGCGKSNPDGFEQAKSTPFDKSAL